jgi:hypothetical protein
MYKIDPKATAVSEGSLWIPIDHNIVTPFHKACNRVPATFPPTLFVRGTVQLLLLHVTKFVFAHKINAIGSEVLTAVVMKSSRLILSCQCGIFCQVAMIQNGQCLAAIFCEHIIYMPVQEGTFLSL